MNTVETQETLRGIAARVREMREIEGLTQAELAARTGVTEAECRAIEAAESDPPFSFLHKCSLVFGVDLMALLEGRTAKLADLGIVRFSRPGRKADVHKTRAEAVVGTNGMGGAADECPLPRVCAHRARDDGGWPGAIRPRERCACVLLV